MGGLGSGGRNSKGRGRVEGCQYLDAVRLKQFGLLAEGKSSELTWRDENGAPTNKIRVHSGRDRIRLDYKWRRGDGPWTPHEETVAIDWRARHLGGEQPYFLCPRCTQRVKRLYGGVRYICRACHNLIYASTQERAGDRAARRMRKLRRRIGADIGMEAAIGPKPRGMHTKTFDHVFDQILVAESEVNDDFIRILGRLQRVKSRLPSQRGSGRAPQDFWR